MGQAVGAGYLAKVEANFVTVKPGPNVIFLNMRRTFLSEGQETCMFTEMTPGHALQLIRELQASVHIALSTSVPA
jgi:hypothetical protein